jgi:hypothetical protein
MEINHRHNSNKNRQTNCQADDIDYRIPFVVNDIPNCGFEVVGEHSFGLRVASYVLRVTG